MKCAEPGCQFRVVYSAAGWAHVDTHGLPTDHPAIPAPMTTAKAHDSEENRRADMPTVKITFEITARGGTPFTASELAEVTSYIRTPLDDVARSIAGGEFRLVAADPTSLRYEGEGEFL